MESSGILEDESGNQYFIIKVYPSLKSFASTADGRFYIRVGEECLPMRSEDFQRVAYEKQSHQWETVKTKFRISDIPRDRIISLCDGLRGSDRVSSHIRQMSDDEILVNYCLIDDGNLTNLGGLWLGDDTHRSRLLYPITVQYIVYDGQEQKVRKVDWHDNLLNPKDLLLAIEQEAVELTYSYDVPDGLFRKQIRHYHPKLLRELLINAFVHKSFTVSGDIMICVYPDHLEISNPGSLPLGVTADNILHQRVRRNPHLIRIMHDLNLMEGEGSGYDLIYELNALDVKQMPILYSDFNSVTVTQYAGIINRDLLPLFDYVAQNFRSLSQKNLIALGLIARNEKVYATDLIRMLQLNENGRLRPYVDTLVSIKLVQTRGVKKGTQYLLAQSVLKNAGMNVPTTLKTIEPYRLKALIEEDLKNYPDSMLSEISSRLPDVERKDIQKTVYNMVRKDEIVSHGSKTYKRYRLKA